MEDRMRVLIILLVLVIVGGLAARFAFAGSPPQVGAAAPEFTLPSQDGQRVGLKDYSGKWVVLYFYPKDFTSGCTIEAHNFQRNQEQYAKRKAIVVVTGKLVIASNNWRESHETQGIYPGHSVWRGRGLARYERIRGGVAS